MIQVFADHDPRQQADRRHAAINDSGRNRRGGDGCAGTASVLRPDVAVNKELGGFDIQLFGDVFANFDQVLTALAALAGLRFVAMVNAWQMRWQGLATRTKALGFGNGGIDWLIGLLDFSLKRGDVFVAGFLEQVTL
jgi:hypothetical protein